MIFEIISGGEKTDWVGKEWAGLFFPRGKNGPAHSFPGEKTDWGEIPVCYTGSLGRCLNTQSNSLVFRQFPLDPPNITTWQSMTIVWFLNILNRKRIWAVTWDFQQYGMCDQQSQISLRIRADLSEPLLVTWIFYEC